MSVATSAPPCSEPLTRTWSGAVTVSDSPLSTTVVRCTRVDTTADPADFYQYFWWVDSSAPDAHRFMARGNLGQFIYVMPDKDLVMLRFGTRFGYDAWPQVMRDLAARIP